MLDLHDLYRTEDDVALFSKGCRLAIAVDRLLNEVLALRAMNKELVNENKALRQDQGDELKASTQEEK